MSLKRAPRVGFSLEIAPKWRARIDLARMMARQLSKRLGHIPLFPGYFFSNSALLVTLNGEKFVVLVREDKSKYPGHKDRMWQILISPYKFRSPAVCFPEDEQERLAKDLMAISKEVHAVLFRIPTIGRLRWWFVGWDVNQPGVRTPAELPWRVDDPGQPDAAVVPQDSDRAAVTPDSSAPAEGSRYARIVGALVAGGLWLAINALLWYCLLDLPPFKSLPPVPVGVAGIFANFYLIPLARRTGARSRRRIEEARAG